MTWRNDHHYHYYICYINCLFSSSDSSPLPPRLFQLVCVPLDFPCWSPNPQYLSMWQLGGRVFKEIIKFQRKWVWWALIQYDWYLYTKRSDTHSTEGRQWKTKGEDSHPEAEERGLRRNQPYQHLDLKLPAATTVRIFLLFKPPSLWYLVQVLLPNRCR